MHTIVIGANAAGMSSAAKIIRSGKGYDVTVYEAGEIVSFGSCGLPYYIGDYFTDHTKMFSRSVVSFQASGITMHLRHRVTALDICKKEITIIDQDNQISTDRYDTLILATGAEPVVPELPGIQLDNIFTLRTLEDANAIKRAMGKTGKQAVVVGAGFIGLEVVEALHKLGKEVRLIELEERVLKAAVSEEISHCIQEELSLHSVSLSLGEKVLGFEGSANVHSVVTDKGTYPADMVILSIGIRPNTGFLRDTGLAMLGNGAIVVDAFGKTSIPGIYAAGDCAAVQSMLSGNPLYSPLATTANKLGRVIGEHIVGEKRPYPGSLSSACVQVFDLEVGRTGIRESDAEGTSFVLIKDKNQTGYYPGQEDIILKVVYDTKTHEIVGAECAGKNGAVLRIDTLAMAIQLKGTIDDLALADFCYAPPFARTWDVMNVAGNVALSDSKNTKSKE